MTKAEEKSIAYQLATHGPRVMGGDAILSEDEYKFWNINYDFKAGYEEAEKDIIDELRRIISVSKEGWLENNIKTFIKELEEEQ